jgi:hypothetical protein
MISYAQNFEDVMLERVFSNVDPIAWRIQQFELHSQTNINLNVATAAGSGDASFWTCREDDALSTTVSSVADELRDCGFTIIETKVNAPRLEDDIFGEYRLTDFDFLEIDAEGAEADVVRTADFECYRPRALVVEAIEPGSRCDWSQPALSNTWDAWESYILQPGYVFAHFDGLNRFYVQSEDALLAGRLILPPGIYDDIESLIARTSSEAEVASRSDQAGAARATQLKVVSRLYADTKELRGTLETSEADRAARLEVINRLNAETRELREKVAACEEADRASQPAIVRLLDAEMPELRTALETICGARVAGLSLRGEL